MLQINNQVLRQVINDECVLLHIDKGEYFELNATGNKMLDLLLEGNSLDSAASSIAKEFDVETERALADTCELITQLIEKGILIDDQVVQ